MQISRALPGRLKRSSGKAGTAHGRGTVGHCSDMHTHSDAQLAQVQCMVVGDLLCGERPEPWRTHQWHILGHRYVS